MKKKTLLITLLLLMTLHVTAAEACCTERNDGATCVVTEEQECSGEYLTGQQSCDFATACKIGTCIDDGEEGTGTCSTGTTKTACEQKGGTWNEKEPTEIPACKNICCTIGEEAHYVTAAQCDYLEQTTGTPAERTETFNQAQCVHNPNLISWGACTTINNDESISCEYTTSSKCSTYQGAIFNEGWLCTHPQIGTDYKKQHSKVCIPGKDEVYWQDDHGNQENIYSNNKEESHNNGEILNKEESCNPDSANINNENCGNCNRLLGSTCGLNDNGEATCIDLGCKDAPATGGLTQDRKNLESWCVYESKVGGGLDVPGSSHIRYTCNEGIITAESCDTGQRSAYRTSACIQENIPGQNEEIYSQASCRTVSPLGCVEENRILGNQEGSSREQAIKELTDNCNELLECQLQTFNFGTNEAGVFCLPSFPMGLTLNPDIQERKANKEYCSIADYTCTRIEQKKHFFASWKCIAGCECNKPSFSQKMNDICRSLGDCGASVNTQGELSTRGYRVTRAPGLTTAYLESETIAEAHKPIEEAYLSETQLGGQTDLTELVYIMNGKTYSLDALAQRIFWSNLQTRTGNYGEFIDNYEEELTDVALWDAIRRDIGVPGNWIQDQEQNLNSVTNIPVSSAPTTKIKYQNTFWQNLFGRKIRQHHHYFDCKPWQAPTGGEQCHTCDEGLIPCTEYRCESLGKACSFIKENEQHTELDNCVALEDDGKAPLIDPWEEALEEGYKLEETNPYLAELTHNNECIPLNKKIPIGITTHEHAQCKITYDRLPGPEETDYENLQEDDYFQEDSNTYQEEHQRTLYLSEADAIFHKVLQAMEEQNITTGEAFDNLKKDINKETNNYKLYVRCEDLHGNSDPKPYVINTCIDTGTTDISEPIIRATSPENNDYISFDSKEEQITFYINEPASCKWDNETGLSYEDMKHDMICATNWNARTLNGWPCTTILENLTKENTIYVKCKDQPWEEDFQRNERRNENKETSYTLKKYEDKITITSVTPQEDFETGSYITNTDLTIHTSGGGTQHRCFYSTESYNKGMIELWQTGNKGRHQQPQLGLIAGINNLYLQCTDELGDKAEKEINIKITHDTNNPQLARVWRDTNTLYLITNEKANCKYTTNSCTFTWEEGISIGTGTTHTINIIEGKNYYLKCKDEFDNVPHSCTMNINIA